MYAAFARAKPITPSYFSYDLDRAYQNISHEFFKASTFYKFKDAGKVEAVFSYQKNKRDEYDIDLPYSSDPEVLKLPQISFQIKTQTLDIIYHQEPKNNFSGSVGVTGSTQSNVFKGIRYLVPNFRNYSGGAFAIERYTKNKLTLEAGLRYDYRWLRVYKLNNNTLQTYSNTSTYQNVTGTVVSSYRFSNSFSVSGNIGSAWRAPSVNELYIDGVHLSAASYEKGDSSLQSERSYNFTVSGKYEKEKFLLK
ncbi:MAG: TonB-dependent receptor [Bacteroidota bacterium]